MFALLLCLPACTFYTGRYHRQARDFSLSHRAMPDGGSETWLLHLRSGDATVERRVEVAGNRPELGLYLSELDKAAAENRGVRPYTGLLVNGGPAAADAKHVMAGDVLLAVDGKETFYLDQVRQIEATLRPGQQVVAKVLRGQKEQEAAVDVIASADSRQVSDEFKLDAVSPQKAYAGVTLFGIPPKTAERIYGQLRNAVVVATVETGSPSYIAGLRPGDVIETVDGAPCPDVRTLSQRIAERGAFKQPMHLRVVRNESDAYETDVQLHDYDRDSDIHVPLIFRVRDTVRQDRWSVGPWGMIMSNRNTWVTDDLTRKPQTENVFSALLDLIHVESGPDSSSVRLLWLIHIDT